MILGHIPKSIIYVHGAEKTIKVCWDDLSEKHLVSKVVIPCFPVDKDSSTSLNTAREWAGFSNGQGSIKEIERDNDPFSVSICSMEKRERGGRAYKVITDDGFYFDLREDVLLDVLLNSQVKGGRIECQFIWGKLGSQMKLVRVGSELHKALSQAGERKVTRKIKPADLKLGGIYSNVKGERFLILGWVSTIEFSYTPPVTPRGSWDRTEPQPERGSAKTHEKILLTLALPNWLMSASNDKALEFLTNVLCLEASHYAVHFRLQKSLAVIEQTGEIQLPNDILEQVSQCGVKALYKPDLPRQEVLQSIGYLGWLANIQPLSTKPKILSGFAQHFALIEPLLDGPA